MTDSRQYATGSLMLLTTVIIWGLQFPVAKTAFETVDAFHSAVFRFGVPTIIMLVILLIFGGLMFTRPEIAAVIVATQPIIAVFVQRIWQKQSADWLSTLCVATAFVGVITVVTRWEASLDMAPQELIGVAMILLGAVFWVIYTIACGKYPDWSNARTFDTN